MKKKIFIIAGARPNFVKIAPIIEAINKKKDFLEFKLIHTGQHYEREMSQVFFEELNIPQSHYNLEINSGQYPFSTQIALMQRKIRDIFEKERPDFCLVVGDCNSAVGGAFAASLMNIPLIHVEAGLRSFDRRMPEETNRILADHCSDLLFAPTQKSKKILEAN